LYKYYFLTSTLLQFSRFDYGIWRKIVRILRFRFLKEKNNDTLRFPLSARWNWWRPATCITITALCARISWMFTYWLGTS